MARKCWECGQSYSENCLACNQNAIRELDYQERQEKKRQEERETDENVSGSRQ